MFKEQIRIDLIEKIPDNSSLVMFGACDVALKMIEDIKQYRPNVKILGFIDNYQYKNKTFYNLPIWTLKEFIESDLKYDFIVMSTRTNLDILNAIFEIYELPVIYQTDFMHRYYRNCFDKQGKLNDENFSNVIKIFKNQEDKDLYEFLFKVRCTIRRKKEVLDRFDKKYNLPVGVNMATKYQYMDKINKKAVTTIIDGGLNNGLNVITFSKMLPNLKHVYGFEVLYDKIKLQFIEDIIKNKVTVVPYCLGEKKGHTDFFIDKNNIAASFCINLSQRTAPDNTARFERLHVPITTIDAYCRENNIKYDFLKLDVEGAELSAIKGGLATINEYRPQLAISIYHSNSDFVDIPQFLNNNLKDYTFKLGHYSNYEPETILYAIPNELT